MNGGHRKTLGMTPYEAFYGTMEVHKQLVTQRSKQMKVQNDGRRMDVKPLEPSEEDRAFGI